ncbi:2-C-methyl-D-erythritol 4-phosphate cytidylyltransferase [Corynebacterium pyruviciproducens]|uniref:2-C-methyl-D-erythritol 4-phosphate cytidylyltransferase n=1 Tax=Corynebacterium pyruviciproducens TaxID=598660 RepID=UPI00254B1532|nr:2-C-methyl-D-erythritol 4-phosphate cytidylyltransferase [Corynebacterium pyruviciproducens]MDK7214868.1 2-C-methyl-D-erythritol 4-phosphate cytidylyltransferase [Corynebacterium pyruviciproducens]
MRVFALVAAAGKGTRLGADLPKAYVTLRGRTLMERSVTAIETAEIADGIFVVVHPDMEAHARKVLAGHEVIFVHGGKERFDSVAAGLRAIPDADGVVLIHDAARALTPPGLFARVSRAVLEGHEAVIPTVPVADTIKVVEDNVVKATPDRASLRAVQTPQGFDLRALREANREFFAHPFDATDDASIMEHAGHTVTTVAGDPMAFKITTPIDLLLAEHIAGEAEETVFEVPSETS